MALPFNGTTYYLYKAFMYVMGVPHSHTTVAIQQPKSARLYYTDANTWGTQRSPAAILSSATTTVSVEACERLTGYTGGFVLQSPTCVQVLITGEGGSSAMATLRLGLDSCE